MRGFMLLALLMMAALPVDAFAQTTDVVRSGAWTAFAGQAPDGRRVCGANADDGSVGIDQRSFTIRHFRDDLFLSVQVFKLSWTMPQGARIPYELLIDGRDPYAGEAVGAGNFIEWTVRFDIADAFIARLVEGSMMRLRFPGGNEPPMTISLSGTARVMEVLGRCIQIHTGIIGRGIKPIPPR